jgi:hypothetical protein
MFTFYFTTYEVNVDQCIDLHEHDLNIIGADSGADHRYRLSIADTTVRDKLALTDLKIDPIKEPAHLLYTVLIANGDDRV